jgi:hypothetical protein
MGKSLYQISDELQLLLNEIEENGGEITEEQEQQLEISQEELGSKVENYCNAITILKSEEECAKKEKQRLNELQNVKKNLIEKLKNSLLKTVTKFGYTGKSGNKVFDATNHKLFTKNTKSVVINEERFNKMSEYVKDYLIELYKQGILETGENIDIEGMLGAINAAAKAEQEENFVPFTISDLATINFRFDYFISFNSLMQGKANNVVQLILSPNAVLNYEPDSMLKTYLEVKERENESDITFAHLEDKQSLTIK